MMSSYRVSEYLERFLNTYLGPTMKKSKYFEIRKSIHKNKNVNKLFSLNNTNLKRLYNENCTNKAFNMNSLAKLFEFLKTEPGSTADDGPDQLKANAEPATSRPCEDGPDHYWHPLNWKILKWVFARSKMVVINEHKNRGREYHYLTFNEFQEFLGRVAI